MGNLWEDHEKKTPIDTEAPAVASVTDADTAGLVVTASMKDVTPPAMPFKHTIHRFFKNLMLLSWRSWNQQIRDTVTIKGKVFVTIFFACLTSAMYNHAGNDPVGIYNRLGLLFIVSSKSSILHLYESISQARDV